MVQLVSFPNAMSMPECDFPVTLCPKKSGGNVTVFKYSELDNFRNNWPIPIPTCDPNDVENIKMLYSMCKGKQMFSKSTSY